MIARKMHTGMDNVHGTHGTTCIVENPFFIQIDVGASGALTQLSHNLGDDCTCVVAVVGDGALGQIVQMVLVENVEAFQILFDEVNKGGKDGHNDGDDCEPATATRRGRCADVLDSHFFCGMREW